MVSSEMIDRLDRTVMKILMRKWKNREEFYCHICGQGPLILVVNIDYKGNISCDGCVHRLEGNVYAKGIKQEVLKYCTVADKVV